MNKTNSNVAKQRPQWITRGGGVGTAMLVSGIVLKQYYKNSDFFFFFLFPWKKGKLEKISKFIMGMVGEDYGNLSSCSSQM